MVDYKTIFLILGILFLVVIFTRKAILKQKQELEHPVRPPKIQPKKQGLELSDVQFERSMEKYVLSIVPCGASGNLYSAYVSIRGALETMSTVFWIDGFLSIAAAIVAVFVWRKRNKDLVYGLYGHHHFTGYVLLIHWKVSDRHGPLIPPCDRVSCGQTSLE